MIEIKDGSRTLQFSGALLGKSSSKRSDSTRGIEFELYRTDNGSYILSRVGVSIMYHTAACTLARRYDLKESVVTEMHKEYVPCELCNPTLDVAVIFPEKNRHWAQVSEEANAVLEALYQYDSNGAKYLTNVAKKLLEEAAVLDQKIEKMYKVEIIP